MTQPITSNRVPVWLPKLAVTTIICWALGANTCFDSKIITSAVNWAANNSDISVPVGTENQWTHPLSANDAAIYKIVFAAQERGEWNTAKSAMARVKDRLLVGHVLADLYKRKSTDLADLQSWLRNYAELPEAGDMYDEALTLSGKEDGLPLPSSGNTWSSGEVFGTSVGFRIPVSETKPSKVSAVFTAKLSKLLRLGDVSKAETQLDAEKMHRLMSPSELAFAEGLIASSYFTQGNVAHARRLANAGAKEQNPLALWISGLSAWKQNDMKAAGDSFALLAAQSNLSGWDRSTAAFWAWRALKHTGDKGNAHFWLEQASLQPHSFYGLMAAHLLGSDKSWSWDVPVLDDRGLSALAAQKAGTRALALLQVGQNSLAESELRHLDVQGRKDLQSAMLALASADQLPSLALQLAGVATKADGSLYDAALYPLPPWQPREGFKVDRALIYALMRHESQFDPQAVSDKGACGLMQLLPATAKLMADREDETEVAADDCSDRLLDPSINMGLGQRYVRHLTEQQLIGDNLLLLLAAYNEGPNKLSHGLQDDRDQEGKTISDHKEYEKGDPLLFLESIPLRQTHDYVQQVLLHYWGYKARLGETDTSLAELSRGEWPRSMPPLRKDPSKTVREAEADENLLIASKETLR